MVRAALANASDVVGIQIYLPGRDMDAGETCRGLDAWRSPNNERGEEILGVCRALSEPGHPVDVVLGT